MQAKSKRIVFTLLLAIIVATAWYIGSRVKPKIPPLTQPQQQNPGQQTFECDQTLWQHIYRPERLKVLDPCKTVSGTIESTKAEPDGDYHIRLKLDPEFNNLLNNKNLSDQRSDLVIEPVCERTVTQRDAMSSCKNFHGSVIVPRPGTHVVVSGSFVLDTEHGWNEIHPISKMTEQ